jgi:pimeloyl-ACP methyl ester carboxylesterase
MAYPLVMIHGMWCNGAHWNRIRELMAPRGYDCHAPTLPGHEPGPDQAQAVAGKSLTEYRAFIEDYIRRQNFSRPPILMGHSMGGWIAQAVATSSRPLAIVLLTPAAPAGINGLRLSNLQLFMPHFARWGFTRKAYKPSLEASQRYVTNGLPPVEQERLYQTMVHESGRTPFELGMWWADGAQAARIETSQVKCPVYVVGCGTDGTTPCAVVKKVAAQYPQASLRIYPVRSHWVIEDEDTEDMVNEICGWLRPYEQKLSR